MMDVEDNVESSDAVVKNGVSALLRFLLAHFSYVRLSEDDFVSIVQQLKSIVTYAISSRKESSIRTPLNASTSSIIRQHNITSKICLPSEANSPIRQKIFDFPARYNPHIGIGIDRAKEFADWVDLVSTKSRLGTSKRFGFRSGVGIELEEGAASDDDVSEEEGRTEASSASPHDSLRVTSPEIVAGVRERHVAFGCFIRASDIEIGDGSNLSAFREDLKFSQKIHEIIQNRFCDIIGLQRIIYEKKRGGWCWVYFRPRARSRLFCRGWNQAH